jgi:tRNA(Ile)-lysidine synthase
MAPQPLLPSIGIPRRVDKRRCVVAVSGGADSTALLRLLAAHPSFGPQRLIAAHVNYALRASASAGDEKFVRALCARLGVSLRVRKVRRSAVPPASLQDWARKLRYSFFAQLVRKEKAWGVATAHHLDDQAETVLDRLMRGSGLRGLGALRAVSSLRPEGECLNVWRPLLHVRHRTLEGYLRGLGQTWRKDASNHKTLYRRNRIRHTLLPVLRGFNPRVEEALAHLAETSAEEDATLDRLAREAAGGLSPRRRKGGLWWGARGFASMEVALQRRVLRLWAEGLNEEARGLRFERLEEARRVFLGETQGPRDLGAGLTACREGSECGFCKRGLRVSGGMAARHPGRVQ